MALSNKPKKSKYQVGDTVCFLNGVRGDSAKIEKVRSVVSNPLNDNAGLQENTYFLEGNVREFREEELFYSMNALLFNIKGDYLNDWRNCFFRDSFINTLDFSYSNFSGADFTASDPIDFNESNMEGCNFINSVLGGCDLTSCIFRNANFTSCSISSANFSGADLTDAIMDTTYDTQSKFKNIVGAGNWTGTIWVDGTIIT